MSDYIRFECPSCNKRLKTRSSSIGRNIKCSGCSAISGLNQILEANKQDKHQDEEKSLQEKPKDWFESFVDSKPYKHEHAVNISENNMVSNLQSKWPIGFALIFSIAGCFILVCFLLRPTSSERPPTTSTDKSNSTQATNASRYTNAKFEKEARAAFDSKIKDVNNKLAAAQAAMVDFETKRSEVQGRLYEITTKTVIDFPNRNATKGIVYQTNSESDEWLVSISFPYQEFQEVSTLMIFDLPSSMPQLATVKFHIKYDLELESIYKYSNGKAVLWSARVCVSHINIDESKMNKGDVISMTLASKYIANKTEGRYHDVDLKSSLNHERKLIDILD